jgi:serine protease Do
MMSSATARIALSVACLLCLVECKRAPAPTRLTSATTTAAVLPGTPDVASLVARLKPGVVNIVATQEPDGPGAVQQHSLGSGFVLDAAGHVITNAHVVERAESVRIRLEDERELGAKLKGRDDELDLALLELESDGATNPPPVALGSSEELRVGEYVVAIGNPFGLGHTVTMGIVSAKGRELGAGSYDDFIQTDASINPGNSGGPLFNLHGQVVGINAAINPAARGIGFAIPVDALKEVLPQLLRSGHVSRGRLGVSVQVVDGRLAATLGLGAPKGALVSEVDPGSPAAKAGLRQGDVILRVGDADVTHSHFLPRLVARHQPGTRVRLAILRAKKPSVIDVTLAE